MKSYLEELFSLKGKVAIVTGASRGIGLEIAIALAKSGADVFALGRTKKIKKYHKNFNYISCDISDEVAFKDICQNITKSKKNINILINSAGISLELKEGEEISIFEKTININLTAAYSCCIVARRYMKKGGSIINISSIGSKIGFPNNPSYLSSKGALNQLTKSLANDFAEANIRVNALLPGYIKTKMTEKSLKNKNENKKRIDRMILKRWGKPKDITGAAIFLCSESSSYVTGSEIVIDGGWTSKGL